MRKNKKRINPRYFLSESVMPEPVSAAPEPEEIQRAEYANEKMGLSRTSDKDHEAIAANFPGYNVIDPLNYGQVRFATESGDPNMIIPLGTSSEYVYAKSADDRYYRIPAGTW